MADWNRALGFDPGRLGPRAAQQGMNARDELAHAKGFGHVIVRAGVKSDDLVDLLAFGGKHQNRNANLFAAELLADFEAAGAGKHHVEDHEGGLSAADGVDGLIAARANSDIE